MGRGITLTPRSSDLLGDDVGSLPESFGRSITPRLVEWLRDAAVVLAIGNQYAYKSTQLRTYSKSGRAYLIRSLRRVTEQFCHDFTWFAIQVFFFDDVNRGS